MVQEEVKRRSLMIEEGTEDLEFGSYLRFAAACFEVEH
jgi:hypothetical protein